VKPTRGQLWLAEFKIGSTLDWPKPVNNNWLNSLIYTIWFAFRFSWIKELFALHSRCARWKYLKRMNFEWLNHPIHTHIRCCMRIVSMALHPVQPSNLNG